MVIAVPATVEQVNALRNIEETITGCELDWLEEGPVSHPDIPGVISINIKKLLDIREAIKVDKKMK